MFVTFKPKVLTILFAFVWVSSAQSLYELPVTLYKPALNDTGNTATTYDYFIINLCSNGVPSSTNQMHLSIYLPKNPNWIYANSVIFVQLSTCQDSFTKSCTFAANYYYEDPSQPVAYPDIIIDTDKFCKDDCTVYMRAIAFADRTQYSFKLTFESNQTESYNNWTTNLPYNSDNVSSAITPQELNQYWRSSAVVTSNENGYNWFAIGYCNQGKTVTDISIAISSQPSDPSTLIESGACPQSAVAKYQDCSLFNAINYWNSLRVAPFNVFDCQKSDTKPLNDGIYVVVQARGNGTNKYIFQARINN